MRRFMRLVCVDIKKSITSPLLYMIILLMYILSMLDILSYFDGSFYDVTVIIENKVVGVGAMCLLGFCLSVMPFVLQYLNETDNNCIYNYIERSSVFEYSFSKLTVTVLSTFFAVVICDIGIMLTCRLMGADFFSERNYEFLSLAHSLIKDRQYLIYNIFIICIDGLRAVFFAVISLCISAFIKNKFLIISLPVVFYFGVGTFLLSYLNVPDWLNFSAIYNGMVIKSPNDVESFLFTLLITLFTVLLFGSVYIVRVRRCLSNGKF